MIFLGKARQTIINSCIGATLSAVVAGCATQPPQPQAAPVSIPQNSFKNPPPVAAAPLAVSTTHSQPIALRSGEPVFGEISGNALRDDEGDLTDEQIEGGDENDEELVMADPTAEDEGIIGEAVFDAAQDLLDQINDPTNIWPRVRAGFTLPDRDHPRVQPDREWFTNHQAYLDRTFTRAAPYLHYIVEEVEARNMPLEIALLPVVESAFQPFAYSRSHAAGIWQFIPGTANLYGLKINWWYDGRRDIHASTNAALNYLQKLHDQFNGDWLLALAAYNSGEGTVSRAIASNESRGLGTRYWDLDLPQETLGYVPRLLAITDVVESPEKYGLTIRTIPNKPLVKRVEVSSQLDLAIAADLAGLTLEEIYTLNPGFSRWATSPRGPHQLLLPLDKADSFNTKLAHLPASKRVQMTQHEVKRGETLRTVAKRYGVTVDTIKGANDLSGNKVATGFVLMIPSASRSKQEYILSSDQRLETKQNAPQGRTKLTHIVRKGDTLWNISTRHNVDVRSLAAWNDMNIKDSIRLGQKLVVWREGNQTASTNRNTTKISKADKAPQKVKYRVRNGDSLARISQKFNVSVRELRDWNPDIRGKRIQPGQQLLVYVDVT